MAKIEQLTPEEEALIPIVREEWLKIGLATGPTDREAAQAAITDAYRQAGLEPPKRWIWLSSPWAGCIGAWMLTQLPIPTNSVRDQVWVNVGDQFWAQVDDWVGKQVNEQIWDHELKVEQKIIAQVCGWDQIEAQVWAQVWAQVGAQVQEQVVAQGWAQVGDWVGELVGDQVQERVAAQGWDQVRKQTGKAGYGQCDARWLAFYDMFRRIKRVKGLERLEPLMRLATTAGWWWPFIEACIITERPTVLHRDEAGHLHCGNGPALAYSDSWAIHAWHGLRIPAWLIEDKARLTPDVIEAETNVELRRVMLEIFGFDKYIKARGAKLIAEDICLGLPRHLFEIRLRRERIRVLRVVNGTVEPDGRRRQFHLGVPFSCKTPHEAVAWSYGRPLWRYHEALRT